MRILLDGQPHTEGSLADALAIEQEDDPQFDASRLTVHPDDARADADRRAVAFAAQMRDEIVAEPDSMRRDGWTMKGVLAVAVLLRTQPEVFDELVVPAVLEAFSAEAERRGRDETAEELMQASARKMLALLFATSLVEGNLRGLQKALEGADAAGLDDLLQAAKGVAAQDMARFQGERAI